MALVLGLALGVSGCAGVKARVGSAVGSAGVPVHLDAQKSLNGGTVGVVDNATDATLVAVGVTINWPAVLLSAKGWLVQVLPDLGAMVEPGGVVEPPILAPSAGGSAVSG